MSRKAVRGASVRINENWAWERDSNQYAIRHPSSDTQHIITQLVVELLHNCVVLLWISRVWHLNIFIELRIVSCQYTAFGGATHQDSFSKRRCKRQTSSENL